MSRRDGDCSLCARQRHPGFTSNVIPVSRSDTCCAIGTLTGFISVFVICSLALVGGQGHVALGVEWVTVATIAFGVYISGLRSGVTDG